jgi:hypothetical protein
MITKFITTRIESIARSAVRRLRYAPAHPQQFRPRLTTTRGGHIAAVCFRHRSPPDLYFATHRTNDQSSTPPQTGDIICERLALYAQEVRERAVALPPGEERAAFMKKLEQTEQAVRMSEWLDSPSQKAAPPLNKVP